MVLPLSPVSIAYVQEVNSVFLSESPPPQPPLNTLYKQSHLTFGPILIPTSGNNKT